MKMVQKKEQFPTRPDHNRSWEKAAGITFFILPGTAEHIREQVLKVLAGKPFLQPVLEQVQIGLIRTLLSYATSIVEEDPHSKSQAEIQMSFFVSSSEISSDFQVDVSRAWGFFFIQNRTYPPELPRLNLDVFLYKD